MADAVDENKINIAVVGDTGIGKTNLIYCYAEEKFLEKYVTTVTQEYELSGINYQNEKISLTVTDNSGLDKHARLRENCLTKADGIIFCFTLAETRGSSKQVAGSD
jgi:small GTP-binding protein